MKRKALLIILDGWGINPDPQVSAIEAAHTPFFDRLMLEYPHATLTTFGEDVGLPEGQMGNSEVGHMNIGAGNVIYQELTRINKNIREGKLAENTTLLDSLSKITGALHLIGLVSDGGVHSHIDHLIALAKIARLNFKGKIYIHAFTDGRDVDPKSGIGFIQKLEHELKESDVQVASMIGRYYAMDRDKRWERIKSAYDLLVSGIGLPSRNFVDSLEEYYAEGITDEFIRPTFLADEAGNPTCTIKPNDSVLFFNFRTDRPRQLVEVLTQVDHSEFGMHTLPIHMITMTKYDANFHNIPVLFPETDIRNTLGEYISSLGFSQLRVAETEKYPHVTYFFNGGREEPFPGETRLLIPSPKVATYDMQPEMSAVEVMQKTIASITTTEPDFICLNFANTDMVGHTGVFEAAVKAAETVDLCLSQLVPDALEDEYAILIIADHGNSDIMVNPDGSPNTAHTKNPVPVIFVSSDADDFDLVNGRLADIAPTLLHAMHLNVPASMEGRILLQKKNPD